ncbi:CoA transferase, partial [Candidatus Pacearchaeota archaeon]|nr:CoA transferase [Candidatus Pacearchaeota archaeon]
DDRWCAIAIFTDEEWKALCKAISRPELARDPGFATFGKRKENEDSLDRLVEAWTINHTAEEVMHILQGAGICAGVVQKAEDLYGDKQLQSRNCLWKTHHNFIGDFSHLGQPFKLSETPARLRFPAPCLGEHTGHVCTSFLKLSTEEFVELDKNGAFA